MRAVRRIARWVKRIVLGALALVVVAIVAIVILMHTRFGRERIRRIVEAQLDKTFVGGATIGALDGSVFGDLVLRDVVINGPDHQPAIKLGALTIDLALLPLLSHVVRVHHLTVDDLDVALTRTPDGKLSASQLLVPSPPSTWNVELLDLRVHRGHVALAAPAIDLDALEVAAAATIPHDGPLDAQLYVSTTWRARAAPIAITARVRNGVDELLVPLATIAIGGVAIEAGDVRVGLGDPLVVGGSLAVRAPAAAVAQLVPNVALPGDVVVAIDAAPDAGGVTRVLVTGLVGTSPIRAFARASLPDRSATAMISATDLDLAALSRGAITGTGGVAALVRATARGLDGTPHASGMVGVRGTVGGVPDAQVGIAFGLGGDRVGAAIGVAGDGGTHVGLGADVQHTPGTLALISGSLIARTDDPSAASGKRVPVHGHVAAQLRARGTLLPTTELAIDGTVTGRQLAAFGATVATFDAKLDATQLPARPTGTLHADATDFVRRTVALRTLSLDARNRQDGRIAVAVRSEPLTAPWLVDLDALVTLVEECPLQPCPRVGSQGVWPIAVDLTHHHVRAAGDREWAGTTGHLELDRARVVLRDFATHGTAGDIALAGSYVRAGRGAGDVVAHATVRGADLAVLGPRYRGYISTTIDAHRRGGAWGGTVALDGTGLALADHAITVDTHDRISLVGRTLAVDAAATSTGLGDAHVIAELETPANLVDVAAWKRLRRAAIRTAELHAHVDVGLAARAAALVGAADYRGALAADFTLSPTTNGGALHVRALHAPQLRTAGDVTADLVLAPRGAAELGIELTSAVTGIGGLTASAEVGIPDHWADPAAWTRDAIRRATAQVASISVDPTMLATLGIEAPLRGVVTLGAEATAGLASATLALDVEHLRGGPILQPIHVRFGTTIARASSTIELAVCSDNGDTLLKLGGSVPIGVDRALVATRASARAWPLDATIALPAADAAKLLAVLGRDDLTSGTIDGQIKLGGTVAAPTVDAQLALGHIATQPTYAGARTPNLDRLALAATWSGRAGKLTLTGTEDGGGTLAIVGSGSLDALGAAVVTVDAKQFAIAPIAVFAPGPAGGASGMLDAKLAVHGLDLGTAKLQGTLKLTAGRVPLASSIGTLRQANLELDVADRGMKLALDGKLGAGTVKVVGTASLDGDGGTAQITLRKVSPIGEVQPVVDADVAAKFVRRDGAWQADLTVSNGTVRIPDNKGHKLHEPGAPSDMVFGTEAKEIPKAGAGVARATVPKAAVRHPFLVAKIAVQSTRVETTEFRGNAHGQLTATVGLDHVNLDGTISVDAGDVDLFNHRYQVDHANISFDGSPDPILDIRITHDFPEVSTVTDISGRLSKPTLGLSSDSSTFTQGQLLGFLLGGDPGGDPSGQTGQAAAGAGSSLLSGKIGGAINKKLPISLDVIRYEPATATTSAAVTVGSWLTPSLFVAGRQHLEARPDENSSEGLLQYYLFRRVLLDLSAGDHEYDGVDLIWRRSW